MFEMNMWVALDEVDLLAEFTEKLQARRSIAPATATEVKITRPRRSRKPVEITEAIEEPAVPATPQEPVEAEVISITPAPTDNIVEISDDEIRDALHKFVTKKGVTAAMTLLSQYGAKRVGDVPKADRAAFTGKMLEEL